MGTEISYGDVIAIAPSGRIDLTNAENFRDALLGAVDRSKQAIVIDFSGIDYVSSAGLRSLMIASKAAKAKGVAIGIAALRPMVKEVFVISRFHLVFPLFDTVREALVKLAPDALPRFDAGAA